MANKVERDGGVKTAEEPLYWVFSAKVTVTAKFSAKSG
jgi:hypothetical protein